MDVLVKQLTARDVQEALKTLPKGLIDAYDRILKKVDSHTAAAAVYRFVAIIATAKTPLTLAALEDAMAVQAGDMELDEMRKYDLEQLVSLCAGLVNVDSFGFVHFTHKTIGDYINQHPHEAFRESESLLAEICLTYLQFSNFGDGVTQQADPYFALERKKEMFPLLSYAAQFSGDHAREAKQPKVLALTLDFLNKEAHVQTAVQVLWQDYGDGWNGWDAEKGASGIHLAAHYGLTQAAAHLVGTGTDANARDCLDTTPLMYAASAGRSDVVELLLDA